jgi:hypothetical protein
VADRGPAAPPTYLRSDFADGAGFSGDDGRPLLQLMAASAVIGRLLVGRPRSLARFE